MTGNLLGASLSGLIGDFIGWRGVLAVLGALVDRGFGCGRVGFRGGGADARAAEDRSFGAQARLSHHLRQSERRSAIGAVFIEGCCVLGLFPYLASFLFEHRRNQPVDRAASSSPVLRSAGCSTP